MVQSSERSGSKQRHDHELKRIWSVIGEAYWKVIKVWVGDLSDSDLQRKTKLKDSLHIHFYYGDRKMQYVKYEGNVNLENISDWIMIRLYTAVSRVILMNAGEGPIAKLNKGNFDKRIYGSSYPWLVAFTVSWCGICTVISY